MTDVHAFFDDVDLMMGGSSTNGCLVMPLWLSTLGLSNLENLRIYRFLYQLLLIPTTLKSIYPNLPSIPSTAINTTIYQYTNWTDPNDDIARSIMAVDMATDYAVFAPMVATVQKQWLYIHVQILNTTRYSFAAYSVVAGWSNSS